jgi:hypothetical protein
MARKRRKFGLVRPRRRYGELVIDTYIYYHNQNPDAGVVVRMKYRHGHRMIDRSKYFSEYRYGSLSTAIWHAIRWRKIALPAGTIRRRRAAA